MPRLAIVLAVLLSARLTHAEVSPADASAFDAAFEALVHGDFAGAERGFDAVATGVPELREQATALLRLANELVRRGARLEVAQVGLERPIPMVAISEDDSPTGGRASFVVTTTLAALYTGVVAVDLLDLDSVRGGTGVVLGATAVGVLGSLYGTRGRSISGGMADTWSLGLLAGATNSLLLSGPLGLYDADSNASEKVQSFVLASTWGSATAALVFADRVRPTRGQVSVVETFGLMGVSSTMLGFIITQPEDLDGDTFLGITAAGFDVGLGAGAVFASKLDWSHSRARYVNLGALLGGIAGAGAALVAYNASDDPDDARISAGITLGGLWGGFALSSWLTRGMSPDYRFRPHRAAAMVAPTILHHAPGLAITGLF